MTENQKVIFSVSTASILKIFGILLLFLFAYLIQDILVMILISVVAASLLEPLISFLEKYHIKRGWGMVLVYLVSLIFFAVLMRMIIPPIIEQISLLAVNFPDFWAKVTDNFQSFKQYSEQQGFLTNIQQALSGLQSNLTKAASGFYYFIGSLFENLFNLIIVLVVTFYLVVEKNALSKIMMVVSPSRYHSYLMDLSGRIQQKIGQWARGQLILALIVGLMSFIGLLFLLPKYALILAVIAGVTEIIPYLGPILGAIPAVFLGFTISPFSWWRGLAILILYIIIQQAENNIVVPQVMKKHVGLNPVIIIIAMLIGARLAGIVGIILAVPVATAINIVIKDLMDKTNFSGYQSEQPKEDKSQ